MDAWRVVLLHALLISFNTSSRSESSSFGPTRWWHVTPLEHLTNTAHCYPSLLWDGQGPSDQKFLFISIHCCSAFSETTSTCKDATMNQVATTAALASGVSPLVHVSTTLSCIVGSSSEGIESLETVFTNTTTYTVTDNLQGWYAAGKMAAYSAISGCLWYHKTENDSRQDILTGLAEHIPLGWFLGWLVAFPHNASSYEVQIQKAVIAGEIGAYRGIITFESDPDNVTHPREVCHSDTVGDPCEHIMRDCVHTTNTMCQLIETVQLGASGLLAFVRTKENYQVMEYSHADKHWMVKSTLPKLIPTFNSSNGNGRWVILEGNSTSAEPADQQSLCISRVHLVAGHILALMGKQFLLSYDHGETFYVRTGLTVGSYNSSLTLFAAREDGSFLLGSVQNETNGTFKINLWFGHVATGDVIQIHPQPSNWWQVKNEFAMEYAQCHLELSYDHDGARIGQPPRWDTVEEFHCNRTQDIPLSTLVITASSLTPPAPNYQSWEREMELFGHWWQPLGTNSSDRVMEWVWDRNATTLHPCPALQVTMQAPSCGTHTRTRFEVQNTSESEWGAIRHITSGDLPQRNCSVSAPSLPPRVFLTPMHNYSFSLHLHPHSGYNEDAFNLLVFTNPTDLINVTAERVLQDDNVTVSFAVSMSVEPNGNQFLSGTLDHTVQVMFKIMGMGLNCIDPFEPAIPHIKGTFQTVVHLGCPPGLRVEFNPHLTTMGQRHYCTPTTEEDICLYYEKAFYPVFEIVDDVDGSREVFTGEYTINTLAGGGSPHTMMSFSQLTQTMFKQDSGSFIWTPLSGDVSDPVFTSSNNGIKWACGPKSPCAAISPHFPDTPEYTVQLEFTNSGIGRWSSSCHFSTTFIVKVHGITMGTAATVACLIVPIVAMLIGVTVCFICWKLKARMKDFLRRPKGRLQKAYQRARNSVRVPFIQRTRVHPMH